LSSLHRAFLNFSSDGEMAIAYVLQTNYADVSLAKKMWNVWRETIGLLPVIVNFCKNSFL
jgi:hypothetical protein